MARNLAQTSADKGDTLGNALLGVMMREGIGGPTDSARSFELLTAAAADTKIPFASYNLGINYEHGVGTTVDRDQAVVAYRQALAGGMAGAKTRLQALGVNE